MSIPKIIVGIQSRLSSSRLPCKAMLSFGQTSMLGFLLKKSLAFGYDTYLLTSNQVEDDILEREAFSQNITGVIRGSIRDVRSRYLDLIQRIKCDYVVRVTGDNPFTDFRAIEPLVSHMLDTNHEYAWLDPSCCPDGINLEIFTPNLLLKSIESSDHDMDLEHVTPWMKNHLKGKGLWLNWYSTNSSCYHVGVDTLEDYSKILSLIGENLYDPVFLESPDVLDWLISRMIDSPVYPKARRYAL